MQFKPSFFFWFYGSNLVITVILCHSAGDCVRFLDFGLLCQMERRHQLAMLASIVHIVNGDWASLIQALTEMDVVRPGTNLWRVTMV